MDENGGRKGGGGGGQRTKKIGDCREGGGKNRMSIKVPSYFWCVCAFFYTQWLNDWFLQVYDTPPMVMKGPTSRNVQGIYDTPPSVEKNQLLSQQMVRRAFIHRDTARWDKINAGHLTSLSWRTVSKETSLLVYNQVNYYAKYCSCGLLHLIRMLWPFKSCIMSGKHWLCSRRSWFWYQLVLWAL